jgi:peptidoglycan/LPS O-acetylase OafA/YrhL
VDISATTSNDLPAAAINPEFAKLGWRPEVSGLRALAVIPVVLFHFELCPGGFAGVDVFFVISGYLITAIQLHELCVGHFSMKRFWLRRARRLFPAMSMMLAVLLAVSWNVLLAPTYDRLVNQTWAVLLFGANVYFYNENDYFASSLQDPLLHCWSLAVEEQYYILSPVLLCLLWHVGRKLGPTPKQAPPMSKPGSELVHTGKPTSANGAVGIQAASTPAWSQNGSDLPAISVRQQAAEPQRTSPTFSFETGRFAFAVTIVLLVGSLAACIVLMPTARKFAFYLLPLRAWELLLGSSLAFDRRYDHLSFLRGSMVAAEVSCAVGLAMIVASFIIYDGKSTPWPSYPTLLPTVGTALFLASQEPHPNRKQRLSWCGKFLTLPPLLFIGELSYSLYLWHWPVYVLFAYTTVGSKLDAKATALGIFVSLVAACASLVSMESALIRSSSATSPSNATLRRVLRTLHLTKLSDRLFIAAALVVWSALFTFAVVASVKGLGGAHHASR